MGGTIGSAAKLREVRSFSLKSFEIRGSTACSLLSFSLFHMSFFAKPVRYFKMMGTDSTDVEFSSSISLASINGRNQV